RERGRGTGARARGGPRAGPQRIVARWPGDDAEDFARGFCSRRADGFGDVLFVGLRDHREPSPASRRAATAERAAAAGKAATSGKTAAAGKAPAGKAAGGPGPPGRPG